MPSLGADRAHSSVMIYTDNDHVQVISPRVAGSLDVGAATLHSAVAFDLITAASVDLVTAASPKGFTETRTQVDAGGSYNFGSGAGADANYHLSQEPDFLTHAVHIGGSHGYLSRIATLNVGYGYSRSDIGRRDDATFARQRQTQDADLSWTHIVTPTVAADVGYGLSYVDGFQANAYRFVRLYAAPTGRQATAVAERVPDQRYRHTVTLRLRSRPRPDLFVHGDYRLYTDTWGMVAHTLTARAALNLGSEAWTVSAEARGHAQGAVDFYRERYATFPNAPDLRTADKELGAMWTALGGLHVAWSPRIRRQQALHGSIGADLLHLRYLDYAYLAARTALLVTVELTWEL